MSGRTIVNSSRQSTNCESRASAIREALSVRRASDPAFHVTGELLPEEQVLGRQVRAGPEHQPQQMQQVSEEGERGSEHL